MRQDPPDIRKRPVRRAADGSLSVSRTSVVTLCRAVGMR